MGLPARINADSFSDALTWTYENAVVNPPFVGSIEEFANEYLNKHATVDDAVKALIRWQCTKSGMAGFVLGLPGGFFAGVAIPTDILQNMYLQMRVAATIAHMYGFDVNSEQCKLMCFAAMCGGKCADILREAGINLAKNALLNINTKLLRAINKRVGFYLFAKYSNKAVFNLAKVVPVVGGVVGATINVVSMKATAEAIKLLCKLDNK